MKLRGVISFALSAFALLRSASGQGFANLDFEDAVIVPAARGAPFVVASSALPYWTVYEDSNPLTTIIYDNATAGGPAVSIQDSLSPVAQPLQGGYSVLLQIGVADTSSVAIGQTGQLPPDVASIVFDTAGPRNLQLTFAGNPIPLFQLGATANYSILGGDISAFAGQSGELRFTATYFSTFSLDNIQFSPSSIPEPSALSLLSICVLLLCWHGRLPNTALEPTASPASVETLSQSGACEYSCRGSA